MGSVNWITQGLQNKQTKPWTKWRGSDGQVAGYYEEFDGLTFLTVKGAGHFVPKDRPRHALDMLTSFLAGTPHDAVAPGVMPPARSAVRRSRTQSSDNKRSALFEVLATARGVTGCCSL